MNAVREYIENTKINNIEDVKNVIKYLCKHYYVDYYGEEIYTHNGGNDSAYVMRPFKVDPNGKFFRNGQRYSIATKGWKLSINSSLFSERQDDIKKLSFMNSPIFYNMNG